MTSGKKRQSLLVLILKLSVIPVLVLGIILTIYSRNAVRSGMVFEIEKSLSGIAHHLISSYNMVDAGDFAYVDGKVMKGETDLTSDYRLLDDIKNDTGADVTICLGMERCLTTVVDENGNRLTGTALSEDVRQVVYGKGEEYFSESVSVGDKKFFAYYVPIQNHDGQIIGVSFAGQPVDSVNRSMNFILQGNVIICTFIVLLAGFICYLSAQKIMTTIWHIKVFLEELARGKFGQEMPDAVTKRRDEMGEIGEYAVAVSNSLEEMVTKDPLTGLLNRCACLIEVEEYQKEEAFTIAMGDIDFFKKVNDNYGHDKGDEVLKYVASVLRETVGEQGFAARWGGEEFFLGLKEEREKMQEQLERAMERIRTHEFIGNGKKFHITVSIGILSYKPELSFDANVKKADELLYYGKENGRNQIVSEGTVCTN